MAEMLIQSENLVAIADKIRVLSGTANAMGLDDMANTLNTENTNFESNLSTQDDLISQIQTALQNKTSVPKPVLQVKTVTPTTSSQTVTPDSGYDGLSQVTVNAMPTATQATPVITVNASGLITATATQTAGYIVAGSKSATKQLAFQSAKTITPTTTNQTAVSSGIYTTGDIIVYGDSNLVAENIKSGVSIFGVNGVYDGSGGDASAEDSLVTRNIASYTNDRIASICEHAFVYCTSLTTVSFPAATCVGSNAFGSCTSLTTANFPAATTINWCAFYKCFNLKSLYLTGSSICTLSNSNAFSSTPIGGYSKSAGTYGSIYVPSSLLASYKAATNWTYFSSRFVGV